MAVHHNKYYLSRARTQHSKLYKETTVGTTNKTENIVTAIYSPNCGTQVVAIGNEMVAHNFKHVTLRSKGHTLINGRALVNLEKSTVGYVKTVMSHVYSFFVIQISLSSGKTVNNLLNLVLDEMWEEKLAALRCKKKSKLIEMDNDKNSEIQKKVQPKDWIFFRYVACVCLLVTSHSKPKDRLHSFCEAGEKKGSIMSHKNFRKNIGA